MTEKTEPGAAAMADAENPARRAVVAVTGPEARDFLNGLLTNDVLQSGAPVFAALLSPQGKILHTLFVHDAPREDRAGHDDGDGDGDGVLLDVASEGADDLVRRLTLYRLRRKIAISRRHDLSVTLGADAPGAVSPARPDPRHPGLPSRGIAEGPEQADWAAYDRARLAAGIPDQGADYGAEEIFPHDANMDLLHGADMKKGCFVGQEVVSRMHRRGGVRKRFCRVVFDGRAPDYGTGLTDAAGAILGDMRSSGEAVGLDGAGLALVRIDRLATAQLPVRAGETELRITPP